MSHPPDPQRPRPRRILVGDIGATHARLAIYGHDAGRIELSRQETYTSSEHACLTDVGVEALQGAPMPLQDHFARQFNELQEWEQTSIIAALMVGRLATMGDRGNSEVRLFR